MNKVLSKAYTRIYDNKLMKNTDNMACRYCGKIVGYEIGFVKYKIFKMAVCKNCREAFFVCSDFWQLIFAFMYGDKFNGNCLLIGEVNCIKYAANEANEKEIDVFGDIDEQ